MIQQRVSEGTQDWETVTEDPKQLGEKLLGKTSGNKKQGKETRLWNEDLQESIQTKKLAKRNLDKDNSEENKAAYKTAKKEVKRNVSIVKARAYDHLYADMDTTEGQKKVLRMAKERENNSKYIYQSKVIKYEEERVVEDLKIFERCREYYQKQMNEHTPREGMNEQQAEVEGDIKEITSTEIEMALANMKNGKATGPDNLSVEVWKSFRRTGVNFLKEALNKIIDEEKIPDIWRKSILIPIFKNKGDIMNCENYRGITLMCHSMKLYERVHDNRLRNIVSISDEQFGFVKGKSTTDAIFALRQLQERYREGQQYLHCVFIDLEKAYDRVPREELYWCMRDKGLPEKYIRLTKDMYHQCETVVRCAAGTSEPYAVEVGLHQGSAFSPFLFAIMMDSLTENIRKEAAWQMMFEDDVVLCAREKYVLELELEQWREALEKRVMKMPSAKTEYMCLDGTPLGSVNMQSAQLPQVTEFKYLGSTLQSDGDMTSEINKRNQCGWSNWRKLSGVLCDKRVPPPVKGKIHKTIVQPDMLYGMETVPVTRSLVKKLEVTEMKMC